MEKILEYMTQQGTGSMGQAASVNLAVSIVFTLALGTVMLITYRLCHDSLDYSRKFNITLLMLAFISTILLALIRDNPLLSLGVLGSLSICRIRTNTKDPRDIGFVFWAMCIGISSAVGAFAAGLFGTLLLAVVLFAFHRTTGRNNRMLMVIRGARTQAAGVQRMFSQMPGSIVQSKNIFSDTFELVYEIQADPGEEEELLAALNRMEGIYGVNVLAPETKVA